MGTFRLRRSSCGGVGMSAKDAEKLVGWLLPANPEVAAMAIQRSGAEVSDQFKLKFREEWLPQMTDVECHPEALARAAIGRALGTVLLSTGEPLDNRRGVGLTSDGLPDIDWIDIPGGTVELEDVKGDFKVKPFRIARYLVTNRQFQAFVDAPDGYGNQKWWKEIGRSPAPSSPSWAETNHPRETVSWYEAVAFCRWLSEKCHERGLLGKSQEIRLPTEWEWQQAATNGNPDNVYPWGAEWDSSRATSGEMSRTSAVGIYPKGTWPGGPLDMAGNVWEWCLNRHENPKGRRAIAIDKTGRRVVRGGSWNGIPGTLRSSYRGRGDAGDRGDAIGFRLAQDIS
jgi:Sulfatase-modifying factor enzyme 1